MYRDKDIIKGIIEIEDFRFGSARELDFNLPKELVVTPKQKEALIRLVELVRDVERKTGFRFERDIILSNNPMSPIMVQEDHKLIIATDIAFGESQYVKKEHLAQLLIHESQHVAKQDAMHVMALNMLFGGRFMLSNLSEFYLNEPAKFAQIIKDEFGDLDNFQHRFENIVAADKRTFAEIETIQDYTSMSDAKMMNILDAVDRIAQDFESLISIDNPLTEIVMEFCLAFAGKTAKEIDELDELLGVDEYANLAPISEDDKAKLDHIDKTFMRPMAEKSKLFANFFSCYSHATEYRADDLVTILADNPALYPETLTQLHVQQKKQMDGQHSLKSEVSTHPNLDSRIWRANRLRKCLDKMRDSCSEVDVEAAIRIVNREMLQKEMALQESARRHVKN